MTDKKFFEKNLELSTEFSKYLLAHPELETQLPKSAHIFFLVDDDPELTRKNQALAQREKTGGGQIVFVHIKGLRPEVSRLIDPRLEKAASY